MKYQLRFSFLIVVLLSVKIGFAQLLIPQFDPPHKLEVISSEAEELAPISYLSGNVLYFVRSYKGGNAKERKKAQEIWQVERTNGVWGEPLNIFEEANDLGNNAVIGSSKKGDTIYVFNSIQSRRKLARGIAYTYKKEKGWANLKKIDIEGFEIGDGLYSFYINDTEDVLLISMAPNDTTTNEDIFVSRKINGEWSEVQSLGPTINTDGFEISPFVSKDSKALYFSSNGHGGEGDADIFVSYRLGDSWKEWTKPLNLGKEINSPQFDAYFIIGNNREVYFSSNRNADHTDIYTTKLSLGKSVELAGEMSVGQFYFEGEPKQGVQLDIYNRDGIYVETVTTDDEGKFIYKKLRPEEIGLIQIAENDKTDFPNGVIYLLDKTESKARRIVSNDEGVYLFGDELFAEEIQGKFNYKSLPLQNEAILVYNEAGDIVDTIYTDEEGKFNYRKLQANVKYTFKPLNIEESDDLDLIIDFDSRIDDLVKGSFEYKKLPFSEQQILVYNEAGEIVDTIVTDEKGRFTYRKLDTDGDYTFRPINLEEDELGDFDVIVDFDTKDEIEELKGSFAYKKLPFSNQKVLVYNEEGEVVDTLVTDEKGRFNYKKLSTDGTYTFKPLDFTEDELTDFDVIIDTDPIEELKGSFSYKKLPFSNQKILVYDESGEVVDTLVTDGKGRFNYKKLNTDGTYTFKPLDFSEDELADFDLKFDTNPVEELQGSFSYKKLPFANQQILVYDENGEIVDTLITDENGQFNYKKLHADGNYTFKPAQFTEEGLADFDIELLGNNNQVKEFAIGTVWLKGSRYPNQVIVLMDENGFPLDTLYTDEKGQFEYFKLKGDYQYKVKPLDGEDGTLVDLELDFNNRQYKEGTLTFEKTFIYFDFNEYTLTSDDKQKIDSIIDQLKRLEKVSIEGYTDNIGSNKNNIKIARWRANAIMKYLISQGVDSSKIITIPKGEVSPLFENSTEQGRAKNRRVEIH